MRATGRHCSTRSFGAPVTSTPMPTRRRPGLDRITAWAGVGRGRPARPGRRPEDRARRVRTGASTVDRAIRGRWPDQPNARTSRCCWSTGWRFCAAPISRPSKASLTQSKRPLRLRWPRFMASPWAMVRCRAGRAAIPVRRRKLHALVEGCGLRARPLRQARGWGYHRLSALGTVLVIDAAPPPPPKMAPSGCASTLAFEMSDGAQRLVINCGGPGPAADRASGRAGRGTADDRGPQHAHHFRHQFDRDPARRLARQGR